MAAQPLDVGNIRRQRP